MKLALGGYTGTHIIQHVLSQLKQKFSWHLIDIHRSKGKGMERDILRVSNKSKMTLRSTQMHSCGPPAVSQIYLE